MRWGEWDGKMSGTNSGSPGGRPPAGEGGDGQDVVRGQTPGRVSPLEQFPARRRGLRWPRSIAGRVGLGLAALLLASGPFGLVGFVTAAPDSQGGVESVEQVAVAPVVWNTVGVKAKSLRILAPQGSLSLSAGSAGQVDTTCDDTSSQTTGDAQTVRISCLDYSRVLEVKVPANIPVTIVGPESLQVDGSFDALTVEAGEDVTLNDVSGDVKIENRGSVTGSIAKADTVHLDSSGPVELSLRTPVPSVDITSGEGGVTLAVPRPTSPAGAYSLTLQAAAGVAASVIPDVADAPNKVTITTRSGDIQVTPNQ